MSSNGNGRFSHEIYAIVRKPVQQFYSKNKKSIPDWIEFDDFMQEAAMHYCKNPKRPVYLVCMSYLRDNLPLSRSQVAKGFKVPIFVDIDSIANREL